MEHTTETSMLLLSRMDVETKHTVLTAFISKIRITGTYSASGRVLILPVTGTGPSNVTVGAYHTGMAWMSTRHTQVTIIRYRFGT